MELWKTGKRFEYFFWRFREPYLYMLYLVSIQTKSWNDHCIIWSLFWNWAYLICEDTGHWHRRNMPGANNVTNYQYVLLLLMKWKLSRTPQHTQQQSTAVQFTTSHNKPSQLRAFIALHTIVCPKIFHVWRIKDKQDWKVYRCDRRC